MSIEKLPSLREQYTGYRDGTISCTDVIRSAVNNYISHAKNYNAYCAWDGARAIGQSEHIESVIASGLDLPPLAGVPISIKDLYGVPGFSTYAGTSQKLPAQWESAGEIVTELIDQNTIVMGKTQTVEFAFGGLGTNTHWGTPKNPWDTQNFRVPGGSSSGAGISVLLGTASLAFGTDTAGSIRVPASLSGLPGLKITAGRWPSTNIVPLSSTLDSPGIIANTVDDIAFAFHALDPNLRVEEARDIDDIPLPGLRFGIPQFFFWQDCQADILEAHQRVKKSLASCGASLRTVSIPNTEEAYNLFCNGGVASTELWSFLENGINFDVTELNINVQRRLESGKSMSAVEYLKRRATLSRFAQEANILFESVDAILLPTNQINAPSLGEIDCPDEYAQHNMLMLKNTFIGNFLGWCGLSIPIGLNDKGLPIGLQIYCKGHDEYRLLAIGRAIESIIGCPSKTVGMPPNLQ